MKENQHEYFRIEDFGFLPHQSATYRVVTVEMIDLKPPDSKSIEKQILKGNYLCDVNPLGDDFRSGCRLCVDRKTSDDCRNHSIRNGVEL